jgi:hypothetical protein
MVLISRPKNGGNMLINRELHYGYLLQLRKKCFSYYVLARFIGDGNQVQCMHFVKRCNPYN